MATTPFEPPGSNWTEPTPPRPPTPGVQPAPAYPSSVYPAQMPSMAPGPPPGAKKSSGRRWLAISVILGVLVLAIGGCTAWFISTVSAPVDESNRFLAVVDQGNYAEAAAMTDPGCNEGMVAGDIERLLEGRRISYDLKSSRVSNNRDATVSGGFDADGKDFVALTLFLQNNDGWSVCGFHLSR